MLLSSVCWFLQHVNKEHLYIPISWHMACMYIFFYVGMYDITILCDSVPFYRAFYIIMLALQFILVSFAVSNCVCCNMFFDQQQELLC
jgi:hypothetical protein